MLDEGIAWNIKAKDIPVTANCAATQKLPSILWNPKVQYRAHKSPPLVPILSQIGPVHQPHPVSLRSILILPTHLRLGLPSSLFPSGFPTNILYAFLFSSICYSYMPYLSHPLWLDHFNYVWRGVQVMKLFIMQFSLVSRHFISLRVMSERLISN
jgi:hypothetical protein